MAAEAIFVGTLTADGSVAIELSALGHTSSDVTIYAQDDLGGGTITIEAGLDATNREVLKVWDDDDGGPNTINSNSTFGFTVPIECPFDHVAVVLASSTDPNLNIYIFIAARKR